jgi:hypothetical protein
LLATKNQIRFANRAQTQIYVYNAI